MEVKEAMEVAAVAMGEEVEVVVMADEEVVMGVEEEEEEVDMEVTDMEMMVGMAAAVGDTGEAVEAGVIMMTIDLVQFCWQLLLYGVCAFSVIFSFCIGQRDVSCWQKQIFLVYLSSRLK
eukprot:TRINITY_DN7755_c0_g1_i2.p3 TRINITY_DN7755_c0_g1~~TRINITY_DN7755_c0_g1_i2.p3  ORF type:complete len:120 (-),score=39.90 TRINITY_DN7755_c0_g1_i2:40-399(-)